MRITLLSILIIFIALCSVLSQEKTQNNYNFPILKGPYLGQKPPGTTAEIFAPGIVSTHLDELNSVFAPDGQAFYFCVRNLSGAVSIFQMKVETEIWSDPKLFPFASRFGDIDVSISPDGKKILFSSNRPTPGNDIPKDDMNFWMVQRVSNTWGKPIYLGEEINSNSHDYYPTMTLGETIYFSSQREGQGTNNIYRSSLVDGQYTKAEKLGDAVNTEYREFDPYISPDETLLIFASNRPEGFGASDLYISFKNKEGTWTKAKNMGSSINTPGFEYCPMITPDKKYFFFTSARRKGKIIPDKPFTYEEFEKYHISPANGFSNIYWIDSRIIETLKKESALQSGNH